MYLRNRSQTTSEQEASSGKQDPVLITSRVLAIIIVPVLVAAFIILYLYPSDAGRLFAWPITPSMSAMMLGATYLGGAYFFTRVIFTGQWYEVQLGFLPVSVFSAILGISTLLHWNKFTHGHLAFQLWAFLYFTLPFVIPVIWWLNHQASRRRARVEEPVFSGSIRLAIGFLASVLATAGAVFFLFPETIITTWPWSLTPLTARVVSAMFLLPGLVGLGVAADGRWRSARTIFQAQCLSIFLILIAVVRASEEIQWGQWGSWTFLAGLLLTLLLILWAALQVNQPGGQTRKTTHE